MIGTGNGHIGVTSRKISFPSGTMSFLRKGSVRAVAPTVPAPRTVTKHAVEKWLKSQVAH